MLGCSIRRFSIGLVSTLIVVNPPAVKHGGGVINQLSSIGHDSNWMKQDSLSSGKCSKGDDKHEKTGELSVADASTTSASSTEQLVQVSAVGEHSTIHQWRGTMDVGDHRRLKTTQLHTARNGIGNNNNKTNKQNTKKRKKSPVITYISLYFLKAGEGKRELPDKPC